MFKLKTPTGIVKVRWGLPSDMPISGDWDGNGTTDLGVFDQASATFTQGVARAPTAARGVVREVRWGNPRR